MIDPEGYEICPAGARNKRKATVKIRRNSQLRFLPMIQFFSDFHIHRTAFRDKGKITVRNLNAIDLSIPVKHCINSKCL